MILLYSLFLIIAIHELGHFITAKMFGCRVKTFSVGFGNPFVSKKIGETNYQICPIILGGYVELQDELSYSRSKKSFTNKTYIQKVIISLAGISMNCWSAVVAYWLYVLTNNQAFFIFGFYSMAIGLSNLLPIPSLDGSYPIIFLFEKLWGKKKTYERWTKINQSFFKWLMIINILSIPYLGWLIYTGQIL